jgi:hypothetical protein
MASFWYEWSALRRCRQYPRVEHFPDFDSSFPEVSTRVLHNSSITPDIGGMIPSAGARLYGFGAADLARADDAAHPATTWRRMGVSCER